MRTTDEIITEQAKEIQHLKKENEDSMDKAQEMIIKLDADKQRLLAEKKEFIEKAEKPKEEG